MSVFDRFRSLEERERRAKEKAELEAQRDRDAAVRAAAEKAKDDADRAARFAVEAARQKAEVVEILGAELASVEVNTPAEAKVAIKLARLRKKELQAAKGELGVGLADERERWRERQAGRYYTGGLGRRSLARQVVQANRRGERLQHAGLVNQYDDAKQAIDHKIAFVDRMIIELERMALGVRPQSGGPEQ